MLLLELSKEEARYFADLPQLSGEAADYLADLVEKKPLILSEPLLIIARFSHPTEDIAAAFFGIDTSGALAVTVITDKPMSQEVLDKSLEYAWSLRDKSYSALNGVTGLYFEQKKEEFTNLALLHRNYFNLDQEINEGQFNRTQRVILIAPEYPGKVVQSLSWASMSRANINAFQLKYQSVPAGEEFLKTEQIWPPVGGRGFVADTFTQSFRRFWKPESSDEDKEEQVPRWIMPLQERSQQVLTFFQKRGISEKMLAYCILFLLMLVYVSVFSFLSVRDHNAFGSWAYDLGIFDQGVWLLSQGKKAFVTVRGLHIFGDHASLILILLVPFYWLKSDVRILLILQTIALASGAIPLYWLAKDKLKNSWISLVFPLCYLLYPALQWSNWEDFHPDTFATPFLLFSFYFLTKKKYVSFALFAFLILLVKEDMAFTVFALGLYAFFKYNKKVGIATCLASILWLLFAIKIFMPYFNPVGFFRLGYLYSYLGSSWAEVAKKLLNPVVLFSTIVTREKMLYLFQILVPVAFLPLLSLSTLAILIPSLGINLISGAAYQYMIQYHYTTLITPVIFISLVYAFAKIARNINLKYLAVILLLIASLVSNMLLSPSPISKNINQGYWATPNADHKILRQAMSLIPKNASVSAYYAFVPHLTHREKIYMFPNPFKTEYWGVNGENTDNPEDVEYVLINTKWISGENLKLVNSLKRNKAYSKVFNQKGVVLLKRKDAGKDGK